MDLDGKVALVTGGSGDIGGAIASALAAAGCDVAVTYVGNVEGAERHRGDRHGSAAAPRGATRPAGRDLGGGGRGDVVERFGRCDVLVNNAAWNIGIPFPQLDLLDAATWDRVLETNLRGPFLLSRAPGAPRSKASGGGPHRQHRLGRRAQPRARAASPTRAPRRV